MLKIFMFLIIIVLTKEAFLWPNHDISTLKLLQIVHRHGERTPIEFLPNDPFKNASVYWPEGMGELTNQGKYRMYRLGQFIRQEYNDFLGSDYSPREVYARSSLSDRCLDSVSLLLSGAYPPNNTKWQWNNGSQTQLALLWQPFPIESHMPESNDTLLDVHMPCPEAEKEMTKIFNSEEVLKLFEENKEFLDELSKKVGYNVNNLKVANRLYEDLIIEQNRGYKWSDMKRWTPEFERNVFNKLMPLAKTLWNVEWDNRLIERVRAGPLIEKLVQNFHSYTEGKPIKNSVENPYKLFVYSTHDSKLAVLMTALNIFNNQFIPFGTTLFFELHQTPDSVDYFVKIYYFNETLSDLKLGHLVIPKECDNQEVCPFDKFLEITQKLIPNDWNSECGIHVTNPTIFVSNIVALVINIILVIILTSLIVFNCYQTNRSSYIPLDGHSID